MLDRIILDIEFVSQLCDKDRAFFNKKNNFKYFSVKILRNITFLPVFLTNHRFALMKSTDYQEKAPRTNDSFFCAYPDFRPRYASSLSNPSRIRSRELAYDKRTYPSPAVPKSTPGVIPT